jgi:hypothetical protein
VLASTTDVATIENGNITKPCPKNECQMLRSDPVFPVRQIHPSKRPTEVPLDEIGLEFDEDKIDRIVNDVYDEAHLKAGRATRGKYE